MYRFETGYRKLTIIFHIFNASLTHLSER